MAAPLLLVALPLIGLSTLDKHPGSTTRTSIRQFDLDLGITPSGLLGYKTLLVADIIHLKSISTQSGTDHLS